MGGGGLASAMRSDECEPVIEDDETVDGGPISHTRLAPSSHASTSQPGDCLQGHFSFKSNLLKSGSGLTAHPLLSSTSGHQAQQMLSAANKKPDLLLTNIMLLEDLIRKTSKEENPEPNYSHLMRHESKADEFKHLICQNDNSKGKGSSRLDLLKHKHKIRPSGSKSKTDSETKFKQPQ